MPKDRRMNAEGRFEHRLQLSEFGDKSHGFQDYERLAEIIRFARQVNAHIAEIL